MLTLNNASSAEHQLAIKEIPLVTTGGGMSGMSGDMAGMSEEMNDYQIHMVAPAGGTTTLELTPAKSGQHEFSASRSRPYRARQTDRQVGTLG